MALLGRWLPCSFSWKGRPEGDRLLPLVTSVLRLCLVVVNSSPCWRDWPDIVGLGTGCRCLPGGCPVPCAVGSRLSDYILPGGSQWGFPMGSCCTFAIEHESQVCPLASLSCVLCSSRDLWFWLWWEIAQWGRGTQCGHTMSFVCRHSKVYLLFRAHLGNIICSPHRCPLFGCRDDDLTIF